MTSEHLTADYVAALRLRLQTACCIQRAGDSLTDVARTYTPASELEADMITDAAVAVLTECGYQLQRRRAS
jgi:hypothetical protein